MRPADWKWERPYPKSDRGQVGVVVRNVGMPPPLNRRGATEHIGAVENNG
jgi:hypothetical protein